MYLAQLSPREAEIRRMNFGIYFGLLVAYIREMIKEKTDRVTRRTKMHILDTETISLLEEVLVNTLPLLEKINAGNELEVMRENVETLCNCKTHLQGLRNISVDSIGDLSMIDPLLLQETLSRSEEEVGVRQPHLFICLKSRAKSFGENASKHAPGERI